MGRPAAADPARVEADAGFELSDATLGDVEVREVDGTRGEARVQLLDPDGHPLGSEAFSEFVHEDGAWRSTECQTIWDDIDDGGWAILTSEMEMPESESPDTTYGGELRPAAEVLEEEARDASRTGVIGQPVELYDGLTVVVSAIEPGTSTASMTVGEPEAADDYAIDVSIRTENRSADYLTNPDVQVTCTNDVPPGTLYLGSTFEAYGDLPPRTFDDGVVTLAVPLDCVDPVVRVSDYVYDDDEWSEEDEVSIDWPVPADLHP